ncbi:MAG: Clp protease N-terminal domain-containing protein [Acidimicrobiales bacterium]
MFYRPNGLTDSEPLPRADRHDVMMSLPLNAMTARSRRVLVRAGELAQQAGHRHIGTEHLLLALADDPDGIAGKSSIGWAYAKTQFARRLCWSRRWTQTASGHDPGDAATVWFDPRPMSNNPIVLTEPSSG